MLRFLGGHELLGVQRVALGAFQHRSDHLRIGGASRGPRSTIAAMLSPVQRAQVHVTRAWEPTDLGQCLPGGVPAMEIVADGRSARNSSRPRPLLARATAKSWVERPAQCMSSSTSITGPSAAASSTVCRRSSSTRKDSEVRGVCRVQQGAHASSHRDVSRDRRRPATSVAHRLDDGTERDPGVDVEAVPHGDAEPELLGTAAPGRRPAWSCRSRRLRRPPRPVARPSGRASSASYSSACSRSRPSRPIPVVPGIRATTSGGCLVVPRPTS